MDLTLWLFNYDHSHLISQQEKVLPSNFKHSKTLPSFGLVILGENGIEEVEMRLKVALVCCCRLALSAANQRKRKQDKLAIP